MESLIISGRNYISSKRASEISGYTQDYVGQLCRSGKIPAQRIGGIWYVLEESLTNPRAVDPHKSPDAGIQGGNELIFDGEAYISSKEASDITGYSQDYIGQLCRLGRLKGRQVGRGWYISKLSLSREKGAESKEQELLPQQRAAYPLSSHPEEIVPGAYLPDERPLMPQIEKYRPQPSALYRILSADKEGMPALHRSKDAPIRVEAFVMDDTPREVMVYEKSALRRRSQSVLALAPRLSLACVIGISLFAVNVLPQTMVFSHPASSGYVIGDEYVRSFLNYEDFARITAGAAHAIEVQESTWQPFVAGVLEHISDLISTRLEYRSK